jgi:hypothetical protein
MPLMSANTQVKTTKGYVSLSHLTIDSHHCLVDRQGRPQRVVGKVRGEATTHKGVIREQWTTDMFELDKGGWKKGTGTLPLGADTVQGENVMTETGELVIWDSVEKREKVIRDFTDIGYTTIHETYPLVASRLRIYE